MKRIYALLFGCSLVVLGCGDKTLTKEFGENYGIDRHRYLLHIEIPNKAYTSVIPYSIDRLNYDDDWIIARNSTRYPLSDKKLKEEYSSIYRVEPQDTTYYWIINKRQKYEDSNDTFYYYYFDGTNGLTQLSWDRPKNVMGPLDQSSFISLKNELGINMDLKDKVEFNKGIKWLFLILEKIITPFWPF